MAPNNDLESPPTKVDPRKNLAKIQTSLQEPTDGSFGVSSPASEFSFRFSAFEPTGSDGDITPTGFTRIGASSGHSRGESTFSIASVASDFSFRCSAAGSSSKAKEPCRKRRGLTSISIASRDASGDDPFRLASPASLFSFRVFSPTSVFSSRMSSILPPANRLERLPAELHLELIGHLDADSARRMRGVSQYWRSLATQYKKDRLTVRLPVDVQLQITGYLDVESLVSMRKTSKYWRGLIRKHGKNPETVHSTRSALLCTYDECFGRGTSMYWRLWVRILRTIQRENPWV